MGAWALVLLRWAKAGEDVLFGVTTSGRPPELPGADEMVGLVQNTVPLRARKREDGIPLAVWLQQLQALRLDGAAHEQLPLSEIYETCGLDPDRALGSVLVLDNYPVHEPLGDVSVRGGHATIDERIWTSQSEFPLRVDIAMNDTLALDFSFYRSQLHPDTVAMLLDELVTTLEQLAVAGL
jgi:non-ribosomal peptide synthetase component F